MLAPFDALLWDRERTLRIVTFHDRISIYTATVQRSHGYSVLPFPLGDRLIARGPEVDAGDQTALLVRGSLLTRS